VATPADEAGIRRLLRDNPMRGAIVLTLEREPDYFRGANVGGGEDRTIVAFQGKRLVCMGRCRKDTRWIDGQACRVGYLAELRLDESARGQFGILRDGYRFFESLERAQPADLYFTSIAADNERARRLLERGASGLPAYCFLGELETLVIPVPRRARSQTLHLEPARESQIPDLLHLLNAHGQRHSLGVVWTADILHSLQRHGLPLERFLVMFDGSTVAGCGALWDQRAFRQTVIRGFSPALAAIRPLLDFAGRLFDTPRLPAPGSSLPHAFLSPLALAEGCEELLPQFVAGALPYAARAGAEYLTLALPGSDPELAALRRRFSTRAYRSRLYRVDWPGFTRLRFRNSNAQFCPEVAFL
jgi:hypothetical protein